ncbi:MULTISPECIES: DUF2905 domain-containing protein [Bacillus]|uniref:DUF2905 domain-containing protein n=1 Tax=Bacillus glycinifermentans TaxID=1664069 RepID=A0AAJ3Z0D8_9BACI|nr:MULTISPECIES: DUF2905 domain-containing protein [Bacillus]KKB72601.1 hypothetical protein TH62_17465 [Bacillus sp. TH008]MBU8786871.1 DUF2905 domain-containing protein [Bacillus glycinifermentans]MDU0069940.1 DUF2905 domain-containing protein [Bacillus sp. IG6]MED8017613.1 DUF2905 domain-containing protein [Bacillus glycinifermentans]NUJ16069.1 DUF2905 domain-containing protein [Bacillus glycinifermentans]
MTDFPKMLMLLGAAIFAVGLFMQVIGKLPGDIFVKKGNVTFFFPVVTCIVISIILSVLFSIFGRMK